MYLKEFWKECLLQLKQKESDSMTVLAIFALNTGTGPVQYKVKINIMTILVGQNLKGFLKMFFNHRFLYNIEFT